MVKTTVKIDGMMCNNCEAHMNEAFKALYPDAKKVKSSHEKHESIIVTEEELDEETVKKAVEDTGYTYVTMVSEPYKKGLFG